MKLLKYTDEDIENSRIFLFLGLLFWIPLTISILLFIYFDISWYLGYTKNINSFYIEQFSGPWEANIWILKEMGFMGIALMSILGYYYLLMTKMVFLGIFGKLSREK